MESLNLNNLANSLPNSNLANAELELTNNFKAAALSLTTMYKSARRTSKRAYNAGYAAACQDLMLMIQQGVSTGESSEPNGGGMTIGRIMDYIEARLEAIKSREEEEDEDEEREKERGKTASVATPPVPRHSQAPALTKPKDQSFSIPLTPQSPAPFSLTSAPASPTPQVPFRSASAPITPLSHAQRFKSKLSAIAPSVKDVAPSSTSSNDFGMAAPLLTANGPSSPVAIIPPSPDHPLSDLSAGVGMKRRHSAMVLDSSASPVAPNSASAQPSIANASTRRRTRNHSSRAGALGVAQQINIPSMDQNQGAGMGMDTSSMDVEEDGRERKRVARR
ncbi:hypothetical protein K474DRAFT_1712348 [Panus rudis PR-1116 ss-1]|nr:hypothetical protein K474DRAFT_1712348 [Panus rudis PR-1116 ss-1]